MSEADGKAQVHKSRLGMLGLATVFASALVGFNTLIMSCSSDRAARDAAQLHQIEERERFWTEAMRDLSDILRTRGELAGQAGAADWEKRCSLLALRTAPFVEEARTRTRADDGEIEMSESIQLLNARVFKLQTAFVEQIRRPDIVGENCANRYANERFNKVEAQKVAEGLDAAETGESMGQVNQAIVTRQDLIELTPAGKTGWDVDIFWCERRASAESDQNFKNALALGEKLAAHVKTTGMLEDFYLGRIRVRMLPATLQTRAQYRTVADKRTIWSEASLPGEDKVAKAIRTQDVDLIWYERPKTSTAPPTKWYVSAFYCDVPASQPPAAALPPV